MTTNNLNQMLKMTMIKASHNQILKFVLVYLETKYLDDYEIIL